MYAYREVEVIVLPQRADPSSFKDSSGAPLLLNGDQVRLDGDHVVVLTGLAEGLVLDWCAVNGQGEVITLEGLEGSVGEVIERKRGGASCKLTNPCAWGRVNPDPYENRGWVRRLGSNP